MKEDTAAAINVENFAGAMRALAELRAPVDAFFDKVTVNVTGLHEAAPARQPPRPPVRDPRRHPQRRRLLQDRGLTFVRSPPRAAARLREAPQPVRHGHANRSPAAGLQRRAYGVKDTFYPDRNGTRWGPHRNSTRFGAYPGARRCGCAHQRRSMPQPLRQDDAMPPRWCRAHGVGEPGSARSVVSDLTGLSRGPRLMVEIGKFKPGAVVGYNEA